MIADVHRTPARNDNGDPVDSSGNVIRPDATSIGTITGLIIGGQSVSPRRDRQEASDTSGQIGIPKANEIKVAFGDRLVIDGVTYKVTSRAEWDYVSDLSGYDFSHYWVHAEATVN